jgi:hypothetical protein
MYELCVFDNNMKIVNLSWHKDWTLVWSIAAMWHSLGYSYTVEGK